MNDYDGIVTALTLCIASESCEGCMYYDGDDYSLDCLLKLRTGALSLITQQHTDNTRLLNENAMLEVENKTLRNELCLKCGLYRESHKGACNGCRWRDGNV